MCTSIKSFSKYPLAISQRQLWVAQIHASFSKTKASPHGEVFVNIGSFRPDFLFQQIALEIEVGGHQIH